MASALPHSGAMRLLQWRRRTSPAPRGAGAPFIRFPALGDPIGPARYIPGQASQLTPVLRAAIGKVVELQFAGIVNNGRLAGQSLYAEMPGTDLLGGAVVPEEDLSFLHREEE